MKSILNTNSGFCYVLWPQLQLKKDYWSALRMKWLKHLVLYSFIGLVVKEILFRVACQECTHSQQQTAIHTADESLSPALPYIWLCCYDAFSVITWDETYVGSKLFLSSSFINTFTIVTDHKPLTIIFGWKQGIPALAAARIQCWALLLSAYVYDIQFQPKGSHSPMRLPLPESWAPDEATMFNVAQIQSLPVYNLFL